MKKTITIISTLWAILNISIQAQGHQPSPGKIKAVHSQTSPAPVKYGGLYAVIYTADKNGNAVQGSKDDLLKYVNSGNPVRVGWELQAFNPQTNETTVIVHWADAGFITVMHDHVFAQLHPIVEQGPNVGGAPGINLMSNQLNGWVAVIGTTGELKQKYGNEEKLIELFMGAGMTSEEAKQQLQSTETLKVKTMWAVLKPV